MYGILRTSILTKRKNLGFPLKEAKLKLAKRIPSLSDILTNQWKKITQR